MDTVSKMVNLISELREIAEEVEGFFHIDVNPYGEMDVQINFKNVFFELFDTFDVIYREDKQWPYEVRTEIEGISFCTLLSYEDHDKYIKKVSVKEV